MTIPLPPDVSLGSRAGVLVDADAVASRLAAASGARVTCKPRYARYKHETSLLVQYDAMIDSTPTLMHAWLFADERAGRTWRSASFKRLVARAQRRHPHAALHAIFLDDLDVVIEASPLDSRLPALVRTASARKFARLLGEHATCDVERASVETLRHKPGRKALLRFDAPDGRLYVKVYAEFARARFELARAVAASGVCTAHAIGHVAEVGAVVYADAAGDRLADVPPGEHYRRCLGQAAEALRDLHVRGPRGGRPTSEWARVAAAGSAVDRLLPRLRGAGERLAVETATRLETYGRAGTLIHGDFYDDQLLVDGDRTVILDLDEARLGHPLVDVGNFLAHLSLRSDERARGAFLDSCAAVGFDLTGVLAFEASALLALAVRPFRHLEPAWPERVEELFELAAARLRADRTTGRTVDKKLPQLHRLLDPVAARSVLTRTLGRPADVHAVEVLRHKRGRRCTLRYDLGGGECVFAKTYAGARAARVHETYRRVAAGTRVTIPAPLGWDEGSRLVATARLRGKPMTERLRTGGDDLGKDIADVLHALHISDVVLPRRHALADELAPLADRILRLGAAAPALRERAERCLSLAALAAAREWTWRWRPIHRDFYEDQLLVDGTVLAVLDLDDAAMSEPAVDVANLVAHLRLRALTSGTDAEQIGAIARAFVRRYAALDAGLDRRLVTLLVGTTLLRLAEIHVSRSGVCTALALLRRSEQALRLAGVT